MSTYQGIIISAASTTITIEAILLHQSHFSFFLSHYLEIRSIRIENFVVFTNIPCCVNRQCGAIEAISNIRITGMIEDADFWKNSREHPCAGHNIVELTLRNSVFPIH